MAQGNRLLDTDGHDSRSADGSWTRLRDWVRAMWCEWLRPKCQYCGITVARGERCCGALPCVEKWWTERMTI